MGSDAVQVAVDEDGGGGGGLHCRSQGPLLPAVLRSLLLDFKDSRT